MITLTRRVLRPFTRTAILLWAWKRRHEILRWGRSIWTELRSPEPISPSRLKTLGTILWKVSQDSQLTNAAELRSVTLVGDVVEVDVDPSWRHTPRLVSELQAIPGVAEVSLRSA
jgi:hypothetical protein